MMLVESVSIVHVQLAYDETLLLVDETGLFWGLDSCRKILMGFRETGLKCREYLVPSNRLTGRRRFCWSCCKWSSVFLWEQKHTRNKVSWVVMMGSWVTAKWREKIWRAFCRVYFCIKTQKREELIFWSIYFVFLFCANIYAAWISLLLDPLLESL